MERPQRSLVRRRLLWPAVATIGVAWLVSLAAVVVWAVQDDAQKADAIIVLGAAQYRGKPSPALRARLDHAAALWHRGLAGTMILTGGTSEGDSVSEASVGRTYVETLGVPDSALLLENEGRTSSQSLRAAADLLRAHRLATAIVVSDPFHMLRLEILGRRFGFDPYTSPARPNAAARQLFRQWGTLVTESFKAPLSLVVDW